MKNDDATDAARPTIRHGRPRGTRLRSTGRRRLLDQFETAVARCGTLRSLERLMDDVTHELGFRYFALLHHASLRSSGAGLVRIDNYPEGWEQELLALSRHAGDPVHHASIRTNIGFPWSRIATLMTLDQDHRAILEKSAQFGIGAGFTVPANIPGEPGGSCSFAMRRGRRLPARQLLCAEAIGAHAFCAARRIAGYPRRQVPPHLSRRELECLRLVAVGKTDWEIAAILGLSFETARQYVKRARAAYDVVSRTQLVAHGLRDARITFDDAIPPSG